MKSKKGVSIFFPFYNEKEIISDNVNKLESKLKELKRDYEIILVDDNSNDGSSLVAKSLLKNKRIKYLFYKNGPSRRENLACSFSKAKFPIVIFMDIDLATDLNYLDSLISAIENGYDISIGSRYSGIKAKRELFRLILSKCYNGFIKAYFHSKIKDHQCGFKAFKKEVVINLVEKLGYDPSLTRGWFWDAELLIRAQKKGLKICIIPVKWESGKKSSFNFKRELKVINYMIKLKNRLK